MCFASSPASLHCMQCHSPPTIQPATARHHPLLRGHLRTPTFSSVLPRLRMRSQTRSSMTFLQPTAQANKAASTMRLKLRMDRGKADLTRQSEWLRRTAGTLKLSSPLHMLQVGNHVQHGHNYIDQFQCVSAFCCCDQLWWSLFLFLVCVCLCSRAFVRRILLFRFQRSS